MRAGDLTALEALAARAAAAARDALAAAAAGRAAARVDEAIADALRLAQPQDVILLAGKGHETYQIRGTVSYPFDERIIVDELSTDLQHERHA